ncbi:hypothetical protein [Kosmotoga pacifica]
MEVAIAGNYEYIVDGSNGLVIIIEKTESPRTERARERKGHVIC